jgi:hypothetical protein
MTSAPDRRAAFLFPLILFGINAYIAWPLFTVHFTKQMGSMESSFIAFAHYIARNWGDLSWFPLWFGGMPVHNVYQPGLHFTVAAVETVSVLAPERAYHIVTAFIYCLGPVSLYLFCTSITRKPVYGFAAGLMYSLFAPTALLAPAVFADVGGPFHGRRFQNLVFYGDAPHVAATMLMPLALLCLYKAAVERKPGWFPLASLALAAVALTNWPGTIGLAMAVVALCISELGEGRIAWLRLAAICGVAYLLACRWIPPSTILLVPGNAQHSDGSQVHLIYLGLALALLFPIHWGLRKLSTPPFLRFAIYWTWLAGSVGFGLAWFGVSVLPQPHRFQAEVEMALAIVVCFLGKLIVERLRAPGRVAFAAASTAAVVLLIASNRTYARTLTTPIDIRQTSEYKTSQAFDRLASGNRVFGSSGTSLWMNLWTDTPQAIGCCDQGIPDFENRVEYYTFYTDAGTGDRAAEISLLWLRAYGSTAVSTAGPASTDFFKPFAHPFKFEGRLPALWADGDDRIYAIPSRSNSLAHVIPRDAMITRAPYDGLDTEPLQRYVAALDDPALPLAPLVWTSRHSARVTTTMQPGQLLSVQISHDAGWNAKANGQGRPILRDKLGQMAIDTGCNGPCEVELVYDGGKEARVMPWLQALGVVLAAAIPLGLRKPA